MTKQEVLESCINKELELYDIGYDDVKKGGSIENVTDIMFIEKKYLWGLYKRYEMVKITKPWYQAYTFNSEQEYNNWKEFCINLFRVELKLTKKQAEQQFMWFDLNYGLKQDYEIPK